MYRCKYFEITELVSRAVYVKFGAFAWSFFDEDILKDLDKIRENWGSAIIINNWANKGNLSQCGLRSNAEPIVKNYKNTPYCSAHCLAKGFDLHPANGRYKDFYNFVCNAIRQKVLKKFKRVENIKFTPNWIHVDAFQTDSGDLEIFDV